MRKTYFVIQVSKGTFATAHEKYNYALVSGEHVWESNAVAQAQELARSMPNTEFRVLESIGYVYAAINPVWRPDEEPVLAQATIKQGDA
jgi:hypothetical protein